MFDQLRRALEFIEPVPPEDWEVVQGKFTPVSFKRKERILDIEEVSKKYIFITQGLVRMYGYKEGEEKTIFFFRENMLVGSIRSYLHQTPSDVVLEALEDVEGLQANKDDLDEIIRKSPTVARIIMTMTQVRLQGLLEFYISFILDKPEERYEKLITNDPDLFNRVPQHIIASFLGITPVSLSRIRKRIAEKG